MISNVSRLVDRFEIWLLNFIVDVVFNLMTFIELQPINVLELISILSSLSISKDSSDVQSLMNESSKLIFFEFNLIDFNL